jgi:hypothetical protein
MQMSTKARFEAAKATFVGGHELQDAQVFDILEYVEELEAALKQEGHTVEFGAGGFALEHPVACRKAGLLNCPVWDALDELPDTPVGYGRFPVALDDNGELVFETPPQVETVGISIKITEA